MSAAHLGFSFRSGLKQRAIVAQLSRNSPTQKKRSNTETTESLDSVHRHGPHEQRRQSQLGEIIFTLVADYWTQYYTTHSYSPHLAASAAFNWLVIRNCSVNSDTQRQQSLHDLPVIHHGDTSSVIPSAVGELSGGPGSSALLFLSCLVLSCLLVGSQ